MSVATLGFQVNSAPLVGATKALHDLTAAAKPAAQAAAQISTASASAATSATNLSDAAHKAASGGAKALTTQTGLARHELINLSRQLQDVGVSLFSGQSPFTVLVQQGAQVADIFGSSKTGTVGGALKQIGSGIASVITPMRLLGVGLVAAGAAVAASLMSWKNYALQLDDVRRLTGTTSTALAGLNSAAAVKGIGDDEFFGGMKAFSQSVYDAKINMGSLVTLLRVNGAAATDVQGTFGKVADLVKNAKDDVQRMNILQQAGLPATRQWIDFMSQGSAKIQLIAAGMKNLGGSDNDAMIEAAKRFDEKWNEIWRNMTNGMKSFGLGFINKLDEITNSKGWKTLLAGFTLMNNIRAINSGMVVGGVPVDKGTAQPAANGTNTLRNAMANRSDVANSRVADAFSAVAEAQKKQKESVDPNQVQHDLHVAQQRIALLGQTASASDAVRSVELQVAQARLNGVSITEKQVDVLKKLAYEQSIGVTQIKASIDSYNIEAATIGMSAGATAQYAAAQNAINEAKRAGRALTQDNIAAINSEAAALGDAAAKADLMQSAYSGLVRGPLQTLTSQIANGAKFFDALKSAGISALNAIASKLAEMAAQSLWTNALGGAMGGGSGGGLLGGITSLFKSANGNVFPANDNGISRYSNQIVDKPTVFAFANGVGLMGEAGAEAIMPLTRGPNGKLGVAATGESGGGSVNVPVTVHIDATGADAAGLARVAQQVADLKANLPGMTVQAIQNAKKRRVAGI